jgi:hypothetical protein
LPGNELIEILILGGADEGKPRITSAMQNREFLFF